jgi:hypothetical protein
MGLTYNPMTMPAMGTGIPDSGLATVPGTTPRAKPKKQFGMYRPGSTVQNRIGPNADMGTALDKLMQFTGALGQQRNAPGLAVDPKRARAMGMLAKGNAVGANRNAMGFNEDALASILSLGMGGR